MLELSPDLSNEPAIAKLGASPGLHPVSAFAGLMAVR
jgi:hypothetical protein